MELGEYKTTFLDRLNFQTNNYRVKSIMSNAKKIFILIFIFLWSMNFIYFEEVIFTSYLKRCKFQSLGTQFIIISDPQLTDLNSYDFAPKYSFLLTLIQYFSDLYMKKSFYYLNQHFQNVRRIFFLGDLMVNCKNFNDRILQDNNLILNFKMN